MDNNLKDISNNIVNKSDDNINKENDKSTDNKHDTVNKTNVKPVDKPIDNLDVIIEMGIDPYTSSSQSINTKSERFPKLNNNRLQINEIESEDGISNKQYCTCCCFLQTIYLFISIIFIGLFFYYLYISENYRYFIEPHYNHQLIYEKNQNNSKSYINYTVYNTEHNSCKCNITEIKLYINDLIDNSSSITNLITYLKYNNIEIFNITTNSIVTKTLTTNNIYGINANLQSLSVTENISSNILNSENIVTKTLTSDTIFGINANLQSLSVNNDITCNNINSNSITSGNLTCSNRIWGNHVWGNVVSAGELESDYLNRCSQGKC